jgi:MFS transporter, DHA1 family, inner membrane transport protein
VLALFWVVADVAVLAVAMVFLIGVAGSSLIPGLQTRLMDASPDAQTLAASLNHSALNMANALGAFLGGAVISAGWGYKAPALVGAGLAVLGLAVAVISGLLERKSRASTGPGTDAALSERKISGSR